MRFFSLVIICVFVAACSDKGTDAEEFDAAEVCPESKRGTFVDERDGQVYKYTTIGDQVWMAQNLNYEMKDGMGSRSSSACGTDMEKCIYLGVLYTESAADVACPKGWRLPNKKDWNKLFTSVGESVSAIRLKSSEGWLPLNDGDQPNGTDDCGFTAIPSVVTTSKYDGYETGFWISSVDESGNRIMVYLTSYDSNVNSLFTD